MKWLSLALPDDIYMDVADLYREAVDVGYPFVVGNGPLERKRSFLTRLIALGVGRTREDVYGADRRRRRRG